MTAVIISRCLITFNSQGHTSKPPALRLLQHLLRESVDSPVVDVVRQHNAPACIQLGDELVEADLDLALVVVLVVLGVNARRDHLVAETAQYLEDMGVGVEIRRAHVGWSFRDGLLENVVKPVHLIFDLRIAQTDQAGVVVSIK